MDAPLSAASALHNIFSRLNEAQAANVFHRWQEVVNARPDQPDFPRVHLEHMALLEQVQRDIQELPLKDRERSSRYLPQWWMALVRVRTDWATEASPFIDQSALDAVAFLGSLIESRRGASAPSDNQWEALRGTFEKLLEEVTSDTDLPANIRDHIAADLRHVLWLIENVEVYGVDRVVAATQEAAGRMATAASATGIQKLRRWFGVCVIGINAFTGVVVNVGTAIETAMHTYESVFGSDRAPGDSVNDRAEVLKIVVQPPAQIASTPAPPPDEAD